jgi:hypothetical protein
MTETAGIHFGPAWLRDTFVQPSMGSEYSGGGGGPASGGGGTKMAPPVMMAPAKLAEFRYGREEMLALFSFTPETSLPAYQAKVISSSGLLAERPQLPLNLMGPMSEDEQRAWQRGANSDTSLRLYKKEIPSANLPGAGVPSLGHGGGGERGRGRGRGFFDRNRGPPDDDESIGRRDDGGRPFGRGNIVGISRQTCPNYILY